MAQSLRNNDWDPESNAVALDEPLFREEDVRRAAMGPHSGSGVTSPSGWMPGYATWSTYTQDVTWSAGPTSTSFSSVYFDTAPSTLPNEYTYHSSSWKDTLAASLFLIKYAFKIIWRKYLNQPIGVNIRWER